MLVSVFENSVCQKAYHKCTFYLTGSQMKPSKHFLVLQTFDRKRFVKVKKIMGKKTIYNRMFLKRFMHTVY